MAAFWEGVVAGYGIAIPVGAISVLIIETALHNGFRPGLMAAAGAASADFLYALLAVIAGALIAILLAPYAVPLQLISAAVLLGIGGMGLRRLGTRGESLEEGTVPACPPKRRTYLKFLGLTLLNPLTIAYFAALILGGVLGAVDSTGGKILFVVGAGLASLSWQIILAGLGALGHRYFSVRFRLLTGLLGNMIVILFGLRILLRLAVAGG